jgi:sulfur carrier protein ThiS
VENGKFSIPRSCPSFLFSVQLKGEIYLKWEEGLVKVIYRDKEWELKGRITVRDAISKVGLNIQAVLAVRDGKLITEDTILEDGDIVKLVAVVSGG